MIPELRQKFNASFKRETYERMVDWLAEQHDNRPAFPIAETPVFIPDGLRDRIMRACEEITNDLTHVDFKELSKKALVPDQMMPDDPDHTHFLQMDFAVCRDERGELTPRLIEIQGFPSLYFYQDLLARAYREHFDLPDEMRSYFGGLDQESYRELMRHHIVGDSDPKRVVLLEIEPEKQKTSIDFAVTRDILGIKVLCLGDLKRDGRKLYYLDEAGERIPVERIYNRVIFDELLQRPDLQREFYFKESADVKWIGHPHWFFRISKHTMPLLRSEFVPDCHYLNELDHWPTDLENYVLKPLYSFAGSGVQLDVTPELLDAIEDRKNYILQRKVEYVPVVETPGAPAKCEIRMLMIWEEAAARPRIINNLVRLSKGKMIGVDHNKGMDWVGGSIGLFNPINAGE